MGAAGWGLLGGEEGEEEERVGEEGSDEMTGTSQGDVLRERRGRANGKAAGPGRKWAPFLEDRGAHRA